MNAGAYGSDWAAILDRALIVDGENADWRDARRARSRATGTPSSGTVRSSRRSSFVSSPRPRRRSRRSSPTCRRSGRLPSRRTSALSERLQEPRARALRGADARGLRPEGPSRSAGPRSRPGTRTSSRTPLSARSADAIALMAEARRRALEQFGVELEHEVEFLGAARAPAAQRGATARLLRRSHPRERERSSAARAAIPPELDVLRALRPRGRSFAIGISARGTGRRRSTRSRARRRCSPFVRSRSKAPLRRSHAEIRSELTSLDGRSLVALDGDAVDRRVDGLAAVRSASSTGRFRTRSGSRRPRASRRGASARSGRVARLRARPGDRHDPSAATRPTCRESGCRARREIASGALPRRPSPGRSPRARSPLRRQRFPTASPSCARSTDRSHSDFAAVSRSGSACPIDLRLKIAIARRILPLARAARAAARPISTSSVPSGRSRVATLNPQVELDGLSACVDTARCGTYPARGRRSTGPNALVQLEVEPLSA